MKLLHIDSSITGDGSVSRKLTQPIVARLKAGDPTLEIVHRDVAANPLPHFDLASFPGDQTEAARASAGVLDEFLAADIVVIGAPMYNFSIPSQLKAWIDRIVVNGKTFRYGADGPQGLARGKRVIIAISRGGLYGVETPSAAFEHAESYLRITFGFIGVTPEIVIAEGINIGPEQRDAAIVAATHQIEALAA